MGRPAHDAQAVPRRVATLALAGASILVGLLALELLTRLAGLHFPAIARPEVSDGGLWVYDATKGWFHEPGSRGRAYLGGPDRGDVRINSLGLRGPEPARSKPAGTRRVLVLGDSYVFGVGVDEEHLFTTRLGQRLARGGAALEVVNAGVNGWSNDQQLALLGELGPRLVPDVVVLVMCDNDFEGNGENFSYQQYYKPYYEIDSGRLTLRGVPVPQLTPAQRVRRFLGQRSNLWNLVRTRRASWPPAQRLIESLEVDVTRPASADPVLLTAALVTAQRDLARRLGAARFLTVNTGRRRERTALFQALRVRLKETGVEYLGLEGPLGRARERHPDWLWDFADDPHWNVAAHRLAAEVVAQRLEQPPAP